MENLSSDMVDMAFYTMLLSYLCFAQQNYHESVGSKVFPGDPRLNLSVFPLYNCAGVFQPPRLGAICSINYTFVISSPTSYWY